MRCLVPLHLHGRKLMHEGTRWGALAEIGEFFLEKFEAEIYVCPSCGTMETFHPRYGAEMRDDNPELEE